jgi:dTDP-4-dehydrorhamnose reductase
MILDIRILVVGGSGYLGETLVRHALHPGNEVVATCFSQPRKDQDVGWYRVDICDRAAVRQLILEIRPDVVINVAYRQSDWTTTADGAAHVALGAQQVSAHLVHVSSDVVFSGRASPYVETAVPDPITPYGAAKAAAETAVFALMPGAAVVRTSLILGDGRSAHERLVRELAHGRPGVLFADELRCPVHVADLSAALIELAAGRAGGVFHVAGPDAISRYDLGCLIAQREDLGCAILRVGRRAKLDIPGPIDLRLDCRQTQAGLRTRIRGAAEFLEGPWSVDVIRPN